jgi:hypothetical protein
VANATSLTLLQFAGDLRRYIFPKHTGCECVRSEAAVLLMNKKPFERNRTESLKFRQNGNFLNQKSRASVTHEARLFKGF